MGTQKLLLPFGDGTLLDRAIAACSGFPIVVVTSPAVAAKRAFAFGVTVVHNDEPARGMTHSLRLADAEIAAGRALIVLPADLPFMTGELVRRIAEAPAADVVHPVVSGRAAHPVRFGPRARARLGELAEGDTLRSLRDEKILDRIVIAVDDARSQYDVDDQESYRETLEKLKRR